MAMRAKQRLKGWLAAGLLAGGMWVLAGCGGGDDNDAGGSNGGTVVTNVVAITNGNGTVSFITNLVFIPNPATNFVFKLPAPKLIAPANGVKWDLVPGAQGATVKFEWEAVSGADSYSLAVKRPGASDFKTTSVDVSPTWAQYPRGTNYWKLAALVGGVPQTWSETRLFIFK
jgi:hypothetical protein